MVRFNRPQSPPSQSIAPGDDGRRSGRNHLKKRITILTAAVLIGLAAWAAVELVPSDRKNLEQAYARLDAAMRAHDLVAYMALLAPDYHEQRLMTGKPKSRAEAEANYRHIM